MASDTGEDIPRSGEDYHLPERKKEIIRSVGDSLDEGFLPYTILNDEHIHQAELDRVFGDNWVFIGHESEIPEPGDYARRYLVDTPLIFTRDEDENVQVLFDSCRHRGTKVCRAEQGNTTHFRCPFHAWTYNNKGELVGVPEMNKAYKKLDTDAMSLHKPRFESFNGLVFATANEDGPSLEEYLGEFKWYLEIHTNFAESGMEVYGDPLRYTVDIPWLIAMENFAGDDYHVTSTHRSALEEGFASPDYKDMKGDEERVHVFFDEMPELGFSMTFGLRGMKTDAATEPWFGYSDELKDSFGHRLTEDQRQIASSTIINVGSVFPNFTFIHQGLGNSDVENGYWNIRKWRPLAPDQVEVWGWIMVPREAPEELKDEMYKVGMATFTPAGTWDQDDMAVWDGIAESAGSLFAKRNNPKTNYQMGNDIIDGMSEVDDYDGWPGPGKAYDTHFEEGFARSVYRRWYREMTKKPL